MSEKRTHPRMEAMLPIDYSMDADSVFLFYETVDVSKAGVYVNTMEPLPLGTEIDVIITLDNPDPETADHRLAIKGKVVNTSSESDGAGKGPGMGVAFLDITDDQWKMIEDHLADTEAKYNVGVVAQDLLEKVDREEDSRTVIERAKSEDDG